MDEIHRTEKANIIKLCHGPCINYPNFLVRKVLKLAYVFSQNKF